MPTDDRSGVGSSGESAMPSHYREGVARMGHIVSPPGSSHVCTFCEQRFAIGTKERCLSALDGGEHESRSVHFFRPGRLDGLCAEPTIGELMCGYPEDEEQIHPGGTADIACRRACEEAMDTAEADA